MSAARKQNFIWPKASAPLVRAVLAGHSALGLAFAGLIFLVCFSGTVAVLLLDVERWESPQYAPIDAVPVSAVETARDEALASYPGAHHVFAYLPTADTKRFQIYVDAVEGEPLKHLVADADGRLAGEVHNPWTSFIQNLHLYLHLPPTWGLFVVGLTGVALLSSLVSGVIAHPRVFRDAFHLRWGGSKRLQEADLHNRLSVWGLPFHLILSLTGALLGLSTLMLGVLAFVVFKGDVNKAYELFLPPVPIDDPKPAPLPPLGPMFAHIAEARPEASPYYVTFEHPGETGQSVIISAQSPDKLDRGESWAFGGDGQLLDGGYQSNDAPGNAILQAISALHFGWFGGWWVKIAYVLLGMALTVVTASGVAIWLARRRDKGRPAPGWERVWTAFCWGQPPAYAASALVALAAPSVPVVSVWGGVSLAGLALAALWPPRMLSFALRLTSAVLIGLVPVVHMLMHGGSYADSTAWIVNGILALAALACAGSLMPLRAAEPRRAVAPAE